MDAAADLRRFYADLPPFDASERFAAGDAYLPAPADWVMLAGDVRGSRWRSRRGATGT